MGRLEDIDGRTRYHNFKKVKDYRSNSNNELMQVLKEGNKEIATSILYNSGKSLGLYHSSVVSIRETPMDQKDGIID